MEEVIVYIEENEIGDLVRCQDCGSLMLMQSGGTVCGECGSKKVEWYDEKRSHWAIQELEESGFIAIEK